MYFFYLNYYVLLICVRSALRSTHLFRWFFGCICCLDATPVYHIPYEHTMHWGSLEAKGHNLSVAYFSLFSSVSVYRWFLIFSLLELSIFYKSCCITDQFLLKKLYSIFDRRFFFYSNVNEIFLTVLILWRSNIRIKSNTVWNQEVNFFLRLSMRRMLINKPCDIKKKDPRNEELWEIAFIWFGNEIWKKKNSRPLWLLTNCWFIIIISYS